MNRYFTYPLTLVLACFLLLSCHQKIKLQTDEIYSRHLQEHIKLTILSTPAPDNKSDMNLLLLNDGQDIEKFRVQEIVDSLEKEIDTAFSNCSHQCRRPDAGIWR